MEVAEQLDQDLFFLLNSWHAEWLDPVMYQFSKTLTWLPVYLLILYLMAREYGWKTLLWLGAIALAVAASDQLTSGLMKPFFARYRPSRDPSFEEGLVHIVNNYRGGAYGFVSSHAANAFAVATVVVLVLRDRYKKISWMFIVAGIIAYSRIYLGVHYPADVLIGALIGTLLGWLAHRLACVVSARWWPSGP